MVDIIRTTLRFARPLRARPLRWWWVSIFSAVFIVVLTATVLLLPTPANGTPAWWAGTALLHLPFALILAFLVAGTIERVGYFARGRVPRAPGRLPSQHPLVCVQIPLFNEHAVAARVISVVGALQWPDDRLELQVLDDSTDPLARAAVDRAVETLRAQRTVHISVLRRTDRVGYKAGALEAGRKVTEAEMIAVFDADFMPTPDYLLRTIPHFYDGDGMPDAGLALVQAQWGHLNSDQSALTRAQAMWVDDHHTVQMSWRAARWGFVNFTGTAGVWRARTIEEVGGWRAASLVEDCELSFRHLFAGYRTTFVRNVIAPAELPTTYTAYKAQQKRWTQGWAQVQKLHLRTLARDFDTPLGRRMHLLYHMCIPWQWPLWALWICLLPALIQSGLWFGATGSAAGFALYLAPMTLWVLLAAVIATVETPMLQPDRAREVLRRLWRLPAYVILNTGMLPHQFSAFLEGVAGPMHSEFERTPKSAAVSAAGQGTTGQGAAGRPTAPARRTSVRIHWPYVIAEACFVVYQLAWAVAFAVQGALIPALGSTFLAACVVGIAAFYGDHAGRMFFVLDPARLRALTRSPSPEPPRPAPVRGG